MLLLITGASTENIAEASTTLNMATKRQTAREANRPAPKKEEKNDPIDVEKEVRVYFQDIPELVEVARCESYFRHIDKDGNVLRGVVNNSDIGVMQINGQYHLDESKAIGFNIYSLRGNMAYARYLYEKQGMKPWASSWPCWQKKVAKIQKELAMNK